MLNFPIYLDYNATTPVDQRVLDAMLPFFSSKFGNASSKTHRFGWEADFAVDNARKSVAKLINSNPKDIIFTAGATESVNLALKGIAETNFDSGNHIITSCIEHSAVLDTARYLEERGMKVTFMKVDSKGYVDLNELRDNINSNTILVSLMFANNEIGTLEHIKDIVSICKEKDVVFHTDATQALGKIHVNVSELGVDLMSFSAHKLYGPKGIGGLFINRDNPKVQVTKQIHGGGHEQGVRSGTLNVPGIVGFGKCCELCIEELDEEILRLTNLRKKISNELLNIEGSFINGDPENRLPGNLNIGFDCIESHALISEMSELCFSTSSACSSGAISPSHVLKGIGRTDEQALSSIRIGLGRFTTEEEVDYLINKTKDSVYKIRESSPKWELLKSSLQNQ